MKPVTIYTTAWCPYCHRAKALLERKSVPFNEIDVTMDRKLRDEMEQKAGRHTVPQIWIGETHVGGSDDLHALDRAGKLDAMLAG